MAIAEFEPCHGCNGTFGPGYEHPKCSVCHEIPYSNMASSPVEVTRQVERSSDSDSGNDEPVDNTTGTYPKSRPSSSADVDSPSSSQYESCHACNGPTYEDPYCSVCHAFLYPNMVTSSVEVTLHVERTSDSDSGNDEPVDNNTCTNSKIRPSSNADSSPSSQDQSEFSSFVPVSNGSLAEELQHLSTIPSGSSKTTIQKLPPELLMDMLSYLDETALWSFGEVSTNWRAISVRCVKQDRWKKLFKNRWPLHPEAGYKYVSDWRELYTTMMHSSCCQKCVGQMAVQPLRALPPNSEGYQKRMRRRLSLELRRLHPLDGIQIAPLDRDFCYWQATIRGPAGSPYEGGLFFLYIFLPDAYPLYPPVVRFITKIYHPNISRHGDIGIDLIHHKWTSLLSLGTLLISIQSLLTDPNCDICMESEIAQQYLNNRERFNELAQMWTSSYASPYLRFKKYIDTKHCSAYFSAHEFRNFIFHY